MKQQEWFKNWFDSPYYPVLYNHRNMQEAQQFIDKLVSFLLDKQHITQNCTWLDTACGAGRHAIYLAQKGFQVTGTDLSPNSIAKAIINSQGLPNVRFSVLDIRIPLHEYFDVVSNLFTSFGYFEEDKDNFQVLKNLVTQSKNLVVLDYFNADYVVKNLVTEEQMQKQGIIFYIKREIIQNTVLKTISFEDKGIAYTYQEQVKLYTPKQLTDFFEQAGAEVIAQWGNYNMNTEGNRCIIVTKVKR
jgi:SAM-dependent methyltransferase